MIPGFADMQVLESGGGLRPARGPMLVEHLFTHRSGLSYGFIPGCPVAAFYRQIPFGLGSLEAFADRVSALPIAFDPGTQFRYSHSTDILGRVIEVACGQRLDVALRERIFEPLGLEDTGFFVPEGARERVMAMFGDPSFDQASLPNPAPHALTPADVSKGYPVDNPDYVWGGHGLFSTTPDYLKIADFLATGRAGDAVLLSPAGAKALWRNRIPPQQMPLAMHRVATFAKISLS